MPRIIDRYVIREIIPPFLLALLVFTFILIIPFIIDLAETMIAKGVPTSTILQLTVTLLPQALALTIPMALLIGLLVGLGRLSADREFVVMMACGISPYRLLQPLLVFAVVCWGATSWVMLKAMPDGNQAFRTISTELAMTGPRARCGRACSLEDFPNVVLYVSEIPTNGQGWLGVLAADTSNPSSPVIFLAKSGRMVVDRTARTIEMVLEEGTRHSTKLEDPAAYEVVKFQRQIVALNPESVFPRTGPARGDRELSVEELHGRRWDAGRAFHRTARMEITEVLRADGCFVFTILGLALGATIVKTAARCLRSHRRHLAYSVMFTAER